MTKHPHVLAVDLGKEREFSGITYLPRQDGSGNGRVKDYSVEVSTDGEKWQPAAKGAFPDSPDLQEVKFQAPVKARYFRFSALSETKGRDYAAVAELDIRNNSCGFNPFEQAPRRSSRVRGAFYCPRAVWGLVGAPQALAATEPFTATGRMIDVQARSLLSLWVDGRQGLRRSLPARDVPEEEAQRKKGSLIIHGAKKPPYRDSRTEA